MTTDSRWKIWDTATQRQASISTYPSEDRAWQQIRQWQERQRRGGRPDVDATHLAPRLADGTWEAR